MPRPAVNVRGFNDFVHVPLNVQELKCKTAVWDWWFFFEFLNLARGFMFLISWRRVRQHSVCSKRPASRHAHHNPFQRSLARSDNTGSRARVCHATHQTRVPCLLPCARISSATPALMCTLQRRFLGISQANNLSALLKCSVRRQGRRPCGLVTNPCCPSNKAFSCSAIRLFGSEAPASCSSVSGGLRAAGVPRGLPRCLLKFPVRCTLTFRGTAQSQSLELHKQRSGSATEVGPLGKVPKTGGDSLLHGAAQDQ